MASSPSPQSVANIIPRRHVLGRMSGISELVDVPNVQDLSHPKGMIIHMSTNLGMLEHFRPRGSLLDSYGFLGLSQSWNHLVLFHTILCVQVAPMRPPIVINCNKL